MNILVTGGAGFIGSHVVDAYIERGHHVTVVDDLSTGRKSNLNPKAEFYELDIRSPKIHDLFRAQRFDVVNHHAARGNVRLSLDAPVEYADVNLMGGLNLLQASVATDVKKFIYISTGGCVFGELRQIPADEEHSIAPIEPYGASKACLELFLPVFRNVHGLHYAILRYPNVYGPRQNPFGEAGVISIFSRQMLQGNPIVINGDGEQERDYVYVGDEVLANVALLSGGDDRAFNLGWGTGVSVNEIYRRLKAVAGHDGEARHGPAKPGEVRRSCLSSSRIQQELGWKPGVGLDEGLKRTFEFVRDNMQELVNEPR